MINIIERKEEKTVNESKFANGNFKFIIVDSGIANVTISSINTFSISTHLERSCKLINVNPYLSIEEVGEVLKIKLNMTGFVIDSQLNLDISLPCGIYENLTVISESGDIFIDESVKVNSLQLESRGGNIKAFTKSSNVSITTASGGVYLRLNSYEDSCICVNSVSGDICLLLTNVGTLELHSSIMSGNMTNNFLHSKGGYKAVVHTSTMIGDVDIC